MGLRGIVGARSATIASLVPAPVFLPAQLNGKQKEARRPRADARSRACAAPATVQRTKPPTAASARAHMPLGTHGPWEGRPGRFRQPGYRPTGGVRRLRRRTELPRTRGEAGGRRLLWMLPSCLFRLRHGCPVAGRRMGRPLFSCPLRAQLAPGTQLDPVLVTATGYPAAADRVARPRHRAHARGHRALAGGRPAGPAGARGRVADGAQRRARRGDHAVPARRAVVAGAAADRRRAADAAGRHRARSASST